MSRPSSSSSSRDAGSVASGATSSQYIPPTNYAIHKGYGGWPNYMASHGLKPWDLDDVEEGHRIADKYRGLDRERWEEEHAGVRASDPEEDDTYSRAADYDSEEGEYVAGARDPVSDDEGAVPYDSPYEDEATDEEGYVYYGERQEDDGTESYAGEPVHDDVASDVPECASDVAYDSPDEDGVDQEETVYYEEELEENETEMPVDVQDDGDDAASAVAEYASDDEEDTVDQEDPVHYEDAQEEEGVDLPVDESDDDSVVSDGPEYASDEGDVDDSADYDDDADDTYDDYEDDDDCDDY